MTEKKREVLKKTTGAMFISGEDWQVVEFSHMGILGDPESGYFEGTAFVAEASGVFGFTFEVFARPENFVAGDYFEIGIFKNNELLRIFSLPISEDRGGLCFYTCEYCRVEAKEGDSIDIRARSNKRVKIIDDPGNTFLWVDC